MIYCNCQRDTTPAQLKPTKIAIREPRSVIGVEYLLLVRILMITYGHPPGLWTGFIVC